MESSQVECGERGSNAGGDGAGANGADGASSRASWTCSAGQRFGEEFARTRCCREWARCDKWDRQICSWIDEKRCGLFDEGDEAEFDGDIGAAESCSISYSRKKIACHR